MKVYLHTFGCRVNQYETQQIRETFEKAGNTITDDFTSSDLCVINSCTVTHNADADARQLIRKIIRLNRNAKIIVTGCYAKRKPQELKNISEDISIYPEKEELLKSISGKNDKYLISYFAKHKKAFLKIQDGCDAFCSYCIVPYVRNKIFSKSKEDIYREITQLSKNNYKEIILCGIRLGKYYDSDLKLNFTGLLENILVDFKDIEFGLSSIEFQDVDDKLIEILKKYNNIKKALHIPLQSGDNEILKRMRRTYTAEEFENKIKKIRKEIPEIIITTDLIVGFPGEKEENFLNTQNFIKRIEFKKIHVFRYSPREGTKIVTDTYF